MIKKGSLAPVEEEIENFEWLNLKIRPPKE